MPPFHREKIQNLVDRYESLLTSQLDDQKLYFEKTLAKLAVKSFQNRNEFAYVNFDSGKQTFEEFLVESRHVMNEWEKSYMDVLRKVCDREKKMLQDRREIDSYSNLMNKIINHDDEQIDMRQQLEDVHFYLQVRMKLNFSPLKNELIGGNLFLKKRKGGLNQDRS